MTIELGNANNGIPMGAYIGGGGEDATAYHFKGSVNTYADLVAIVNPSQGDVYDVKENGKNYAWTGAEWDDLGGMVDLSGYYDKTEVDALFGEIDGGDAEKPEAKLIIPATNSQTGSSTQINVAPMKSDTYTIENIEE